jgi:hypothetical protein
MDIIHDHLSNTCDPYSTNGDEPKAETSRSQSPNSTESDHLRSFHAELDALLYHNLNPSSDSSGSEWDDEDPKSPFRFLDLPLEIQLEVVEVLSETFETYDLSISWHPLLELRQ